MPVLAHSYAHFQAAAGPPSPSSPGAYVTHDFGEGTNGTALTGGSAGNTAAVGQCYFNAVSTANGTVTYSSAQKAHGTLSMLVHWTGTGSGPYAEWNSQLTYGNPAGGLGTLWFRVYLQLAALPSAPVRVLQVNTASDAAMCSGLYVNADGTLSMSDTNGTARVTTTAAVSSGAWFRAEAYVTGSATAGQVELKLFTSMDAASPAETQTSGTGLNTAGPCATILLGSSANSTTPPDIYYDDPGASAFGYMGPASLPDSTLTVSSGGTYSNATYVSNSSGTSAITISTTAAVTLDRLTVYHAGRGITMPSGMNVTVTNCTFIALAAGTTTDGPAITANPFGAGSLTVQHCRFIGGHGIMIYGSTPATLVSISYNDFIDIARMTVPGQYMGAVHGGANGMSLPGGATITWNRVTNHHNQSISEDNFSFTGCNAAAASRLYIGHNLVNGEYPSLAQGGAGCASSSGTAIDMGDLEGSYHTSQYNTVLRTSNVGIMIASGNGHVIDSCTAISTGYADDGVRCSSTYGNGINCATQDSYTQITNATVTGNTAGFLRYTGSAWERSDFYIPDATTTSGNTSLGHTPAEADIAAAIAAWEDSVTTAGVTIGPA